MSGSHLDPIGELSSIIAVFQMFGQGYSLCAGVAADTIIGKRAIFSINLRGEQNRCSIAHRFGLQSVYRDDF